MTADLACDFDHILWPIFGAPCLSLRHVSARAQVPVLGLVTVARRTHILISCHHAGLVSQDGSQLPAHNTHGEAKHGGPQQTVAWVFLKVGTGLEPIRHFLSPAVPEARGTHTFD